MLKKLHLYNKLVVALLLVSSLAGSLIISPQASAASSYDTVVSPAPYWKVVDNMGISHDTNIEDAIENISNTQQKARCEAAYAKFTQMDYRTYDLNQPYRLPVTHARAFATDEMPPQTQWATSGPVKSAQSTWHNVVAIQLTYDDANNEVTATCTDGTNDVIMTYALAWNDGFIPLRTYLTENFQVDYPSGYEGDLIPSNTRTGLIEGNVICANSNNIISSVYVNAQSGLDGNAKISDAGNGGKNYRYYLSEESPYSIVLMCDGDPFYGPTVDGDFYYDYNWVCTTTGGLNVCATS